MKRLTRYSIIAILFSGCVPTKENSKYLFSSGEYIFRSGADKKKAYLRIKEDAVQVFDKTNNSTYDTEHYSTIVLTDTIGTEAKQYTFTKSSFDLDLISIPLKLRPALTDFPAQLNATVNGGLFIGRRADIYKLTRRKNALGTQVSSLRHYGFSVGAFTGIGSAVMNPSVTRNAISTEYDGVVIPVGVTALAGYNNLTFGVATGIDHLLSSDRSVWI